MIIIKHCVWHVTPENPEQRWEHIKCRQLDMWMWGRPLHLYILRNGSEHVCIE